MGGGRSTYEGERTSAFWILVEKPEGKGRLGRPRRGWNDNITMDIQDVEW